MRTMAIANHRLFRLTPQQVRVLHRRQVVFLDTAEQIVTLVSHTARGSTLRLVSSHLSPASFRVLGVLLLAAPNVASYPMLVAGLYGSNECFEALLLTGSLLASEYQAEVAERARQLGLLSEAACEQLLQPMRYAVKGVKQALSQKPFGWEVENHYRQGYLLTEVSQS